MIRPLGTDFKVYYLPESRYPDAREIQEQVERRNKRNKIINKMIIEPLNKILSK